MGKKDIPIKHIPGPEGVRGRNSDNTLIKQVLGWAPTTPLKEGLNYTHAWISKQIEDYVKSGGTIADLTQSKIVSQTMSDKSTCPARTRRRRLASKCTDHSRPANSDATNPRAGAAVGSLRLAGRRQKGFSCGWHTKFRQHVWCVPIDWVMSDVNRRKP